MALCNRDYNHYCAHFGSSQKKKKSLLVGSWWINCWNWSQGWGQDCCLEHCFWSCYPWRASVWVVTEVPDSPDSEVELSSLAFHSLSLCDNSGSTTLCSAFPSLWNNSPETWKNETNKNMIFKYYHNSAIESKLTDNL